MVKVDLKGVNDRLEDLIDKGKYALANQALADMNQFVPKRTGQLRTSSFLVGTEQIVWNTPYARRQFYEQNTNYTTSGTGPRWDEVARRKYGSQWAEIVARAMK